VKENSGGFELLDARGYRLAYIHTRDPKTAADVAKVLTSEEGRIFVERLAMLPAWFPPIID
jgi:hypothetical protein